jgi:hypothetical protein
MSPPCKTGQPCPEIEKAKLEVSSEFAQALMSAVNPLLAEINKTGQDMAVYAERMKFGAERFELVESDVKVIKHQCIKFQSFVDTHQGQEQAAAECGRRAGRNTGLIFGAINLLLVAIGLYLTYKGLARLPV